MIYMICSSLDIEQNILKLVILGHLVPFYHHKNLKIKVLKNEKFAGDIILHMCTKNHNHMITVPEIRSETGTILCDFELFFAF